MVTFSKPCDRGQNMIPITILGLLAVVVVVLVYGSHRWQSARAAMHAALEAARRPIEPSHYDSGNWRACPRRCNATFAPYSRTAKR